MKPASKELVLKANDSFAEMSTWGELYPYIYGRFGELNNTTSEMGEMKQQKFKVKDGKRVDIGQYSRKEYKQTELL